MAVPHDFPGSNHHFGPPPGREDSVGWLHLFSNGLHVVSAWKPTESELAKLNAGESIFVSHMSGSRIVQTENGDVRVPVVYPAFVGCESECASVVADNGKVWKK